MTSLSDDAVLSDQINHSPIGAQDGSHNDLEALPMIDLHISVDGIMKSINLTVASFETIQNVKRHLLEIPDTCTITCYHLQDEKNQILDNDLASLGHYLDSSSMSSTADQDPRTKTMSLHLKLVQDSYTHRESRIHLLNFRNLLEMNTHEEKVSTFVPTPSITPWMLMEMGKSSPEQKNIQWFTRDSNDPIEKPIMRQIYPKWLNEKEMESISSSTSVDTSNGEKSNSYPSHSSFGKIQCLQSLHYSGFNPPSPHRRLQGDFYYLELITLEGEKYDIIANRQGFQSIQRSRYSRYYLSSLTNLSVQKTTCHPLGWRIGSNSSTSDDNITIDPPSASSPTLASCIDTLSPLFKNRLGQLLQMMGSREMYAHLVVPFVPRPWMLPPTQGHEYDMARAQDDLMISTEIECNIHNQVRDWNEELQTCREMPRQSMEERIARDRAWFRTHVDFIEAATQGLMAIFYSQVPPINPHESKRSWMYIYNNIFYTQVNDIRAIYKDARGDETLYKIVNNDLVSLRQYLQCDPQDLYSLNSVIFDYRGTRIVAQTIIPGLFMDLLSADETILYGSMDEKTIGADPEFHQRIANIAPYLHLKEHRVLSQFKDGSCQEVRKIWTSADVKGLIGKDNRYYLVDFAHLQPRDYHYRNKKWPEAVYRPELISNYLTSLMQSKKAKQEQMVKREEESCITKNEQPSGDYQDADTLEDQLDTILEIRFNTDLFLPQSVLMDSPEELEKDEALSASVSRYLLETVFIQFVNHLSTGVNTPVDTFTLTSTMHQYGINMRYLGHLANLVAIHAPIYLTLIHREMLIRASKTLFSRLLSDVPDQLTIEWICHFLNVFFDHEAANYCHDLCPHGDLLVIKDSTWGETSQISSSSKFESPMGLNGQPPFDAVSSFSASYLWHDIRQLVKDKYDYIFTNRIPGHLFEASMLRALCLRLGICIQSRQYGLETQGSIFNIDDIIGLVPIIKHVPPYSSDAAYILNIGKEYLSQGDFETAHEIYQEALVVLHKIYGPMHLDIGYCFSDLAIISYQLNQLDQANDYQNKATLIMERVQGVDHFDTAHAYFSLSHLIQAQFPQDQRAIMSIQRAIYLTTLNAGYHHPKLLMAYLSLAGLYQQTEQWDNVLEVSKRALHLIQQNLDIHFDIDHHSNLEIKVDIKDAHLYVMITIILHLIAEANTALGHFRKALGCEMKNYQLLKALNIEESDARLVKSNYWLRILTQKAVEVEVALGKAKPDSNIDLKKMAKETLILLNKLDVSLEMAVTLKSTSNPTAWAKLGSSINMAKTLSISSSNHQSLPSSKSTVSTSHVSSQTSNTTEKGSNQCKQQQGSSVKNQDTSEKSKVEVVANMTRTSKQGPASRKRSQANKRH